MDVDGTVVNWFAEQTSTWVMLGLAIIVLVGFFVLGKKDRRRN